MSLSGCFIIMMAMMMVIVIIGLWMRVPLPDGARVACAPAPPDSRPPPHAGGWKLEAGSHGTQSQLGYITQAGSTRQQQHTHTRRLRYSPSNLRFLRRAAHLIS